MSKLSLSLKRRVALLAMGGSTFFFGGFGGFGSDFRPNCWADAQNRDITTLFQTAGTEAIASASESYFTDGSDYERIIRVPATTFVQALWSNWVFEQMPQDARFVNVAVE